MIHGVIQNGSILPLDPIPQDWDGREVTIEAAVEGPSDMRADIEKWYADLNAFGSAQYDTGEREQVDRFLTEVDKSVKEQMKQSWARFDDHLPA